jgi:hypothetical protein
MRQALAFVAVASLLACSKDGGSIAPEIANMNTSDGGTPDGGNPSDPSNPSNPSAPGADTTVSGTRLKRRVFKGADGSQQFVGWYDSQLMRPCNFSNGSDGKLRCLPQSSSTVGYYGDPGCSSPLAFVSKGCAPEPTTFTTVSSCGTATQAVLTTGAAYTGTSIYLKNGVGGCVASPTPQGNDLYFTGAEVPPSSFVDATEDHI